MTRRAGKRAVIFAAMIATTVSFRGMSGFAQSAGIPELPAEPYDYVGYAVTGSPAQFDRGGFLSANSGDNTPASNPITNAGATLGRVLFYDKRLSHNNTTSCNSCHQQETGFADSAQFSAGADGELTERRSMSLANAKFYQNGRFFSDESSASLEEQVLLPIQNPVELGSNLDDVIAKLRSASFYSPLFQAAYGTNEITSDRVSKSISQFIRSMVSYGSKFDTAYDEHGDADFDSVFTAQENLGREIFHGVGRCSFCHTSTAQVARQTHNTGLDLVTQDEGAGDGEFKATSLRNVAVREFYMHDGRFSSLEEVVAFYNEGIQENPNLDFRLRDSQNDNAAIQFGFSPDEQDALVAFLETLTDWDFLTDPKFSDPFVLPCDLNDDLVCDIQDLNRLLAVGIVADGVAVDSDNGNLDLNGSSQIDNDDVTSWLQIAGESNGLGIAYARGDANLDGVVDAADFHLWEAGKFKFNSRWDAGDFNGDGRVDVSDFNVWNTNSWPSAAVESVPEPRIPVILWAAWLGLAIQFRRRRPV